VSPRPKATRVVRLANGRLRVQLPGRGRNGRGTVVVASPELIARAAVEPAPGERVPDGARDGGPDSEASGAQDVRPKAPTNVA